MRPNRPGDPVCERLLAWARRTPSVRAVLLTGSRAIEGATVDSLSDYDIVVYSRDPESLLASEAWADELGPVLLRLPMPGQPWKHPTRLVLYWDRTRIDFTIRSIEEMRETVTSGRLPEDMAPGYRVLLDEDGLAAGLPAPSLHPDAPAAPDSEEFERVIHEFWWESLYVAKHLRRGELLPARYSFECVMRVELLLRMLQWHLDLRVGPSSIPRVFGRGLRKDLSPEVWSEIEATCVGPGIEEGWHALFRMTRLFRALALEIAETGGLTYPQDVDAAVTAYLQEIRYGGDEPDAR